MISTAEGKLIKVLIGQVALSRSPNVLESVLGSCIGLSMYDPEEGVGGMAHILLPNSSGKTPGALPGKYADHAVPCLINALLQHGARLERIKAKIGGGASMFENSLGQSTRQVGAANVQAVRDLLRKRNIPLVSSEVGGSAGRKMNFELSSFRVTIETFREQETAG